MLHGALQLLDGHMTQCPMQVHLGVKMAAVNLVTVQRESADFCH